MNWHPHPEQLRAFAVGEGSEAEFCRIEEHVHHCTPCLRVLEDLGNSSSVQVDIEACANSPIPWPEGSQLSKETPGTSSVEPSLSEQDTDIEKVGGYPQRLGPYELHNVIGEGGMGIVFRATQQEPIVRQVALKVLKPGAISDVALRRFGFECQTLASLDHSGIANFLDAGECDGFHYFVMELIEGTTLTAYCDDRHLSIDARLKLFVQVCETVHYAHRKAVIHRDLKPSNILVASREHEAQVKIIDFGIAKSTGEQNTSPVLTQFGQVLGTWQYMSPEQLNLDTTAIDIRSDVYSLGAVLYELLCGSPPVAVPHSRRAQVDAIYRAIREQEPTSLATRLLESDEPSDVAAKRSVSEDRLKRRLTGELDWIVHKALSKDIAERYQSAEELAEDLRRYLRNAPLSIRSASKWLATRKYIRRHRGPLLAAVLILTSTGAGAGSFLWQQLEIGAINRERAERTYVAEAQLAITAYWEGNFGRSVSLVEGLLPKAGSRDHVGWELRYLNQLCRPKELVGTFQYGVHLIRDVEFSPNGEWLAIAQKSSQCAAVLHVQSKQIVAELNCDHQGVAVEFMPQGDRLAVVTNNGELYLWDFLANEVVYRDRPCERRLRGVAIRPDGRQLAICGDTGIYWYDLQDLASGPIHFYSSDKLVTDVNYSPDGTMLIAGDRTDARFQRWAEITLFDSQTMGKMGVRRVVMAEGTHATEVRSVEFFHNNAQVLVGLSNGVIFVWQLGPRDPDTGLFEFPTSKVVRAYGDGDVYSVKQAHASRFMAAGASNNRVLVWDGRQDLPDGTPIEQPYLTTLRGHSSRIQALDFCPRTGLLASADNDALIRFWKPTPEPHWISTGDSVLQCMALSSDAQWIASGTAAGDVECWQVGNSRRVLSYSTGTGRVPDVEFLPTKDPNACCLAAIDLEGNLHLLRFERPLFSLETSGQVESRTLEGSYVRCVFDAGSASLWLSCKDGTLQRLGIDNLFETERPATRTYVVDPDQKPIVVAELMAESDLLITASQNRWIRTVNKQTGQTTELLRPEFPVRQIAVSPDGRFLAIGGESRRILVYDRHTGTQQDLLGHSAPVLCIQFSKDGSRLASGAEDLRLRLWETENWREVFWSAEVHAPIRDLSFSEDDTRLVVGGSNKLMVLEAPPFRETKSTP